MSIFSGFKKKGRNRAVVVGLDGVPYTMINNLRSKKRIQNINKIVSDGYFGQMEVCIPEISSVSWSSFMTGTQSGNHGIYGFIDLEPSSYNMFFPNFRNLKAPTLWDEIAIEEKKSVIINMPSTYPARKIDGALISGFVAVDLEKAVFPQSVLPKLKEIGYRIDIDTMKGRQDHEFLIRDLEATLEIRRKAFDYFWDQVDWDLFIFVITGTDRIMHFLWNAYEDESHPYHKEFLDYYDRVDEVVGHIYHRYLELEGSQNANNQFIMLSDHGFTGIKTEVFINKWLQEHNYLKFSNDNPKTIMDIGEGTVAFAMDPSRIYINLKGKYPKGKVQKEDIGKICDELTDGLAGITYTNDQKIVKKIFRKDELYYGPHIGDAPEIVLLSNYGFDLKGRVNVDGVFGMSGLVGMHTQDDAFFYHSGAKECRTIFDVKNVIQKSLVSRS